MNWDWDKLQERKRRQSGNRKPPEPHDNDEDMENGQRGSANCFCISGGNDLYFLKDYQSRFTESDLYRETCLINYLIKQ